MQRRKLIYFPRTDAYLIYTSLYRAVELSTLSLLCTVYRFNMPEISITWLINIHREPRACWPSATTLVLFSDSMILRITMLPHSCDIGDVFLTEAQPINRHISDINIFVNYNWVDTQWQ